MFSQLEDFRVDVGLHADHLSRLFMDSFQRVNNSPPLHDEITHEKMGKKHEKTFLFKWQPTVFLPDHIPEDEETHQQVPPSTPQFFYSYLVYDRRSNTHTHTHTTSRVKKKKI